MATWVEGIVQALKNLGGQAKRKDILEEVRRIRKEPLPLHAIDVMQRCIETHSSDSACFQGKDYFKRCMGAERSGRRGTEAGWGSIPRPAFRQFGSDEERKG